VKGQHTGPAFAEDPVEDERVEMNIESDAAREALDGRHGPGVAVANAARAGAARVEGEQRSAGLSTR